ncbi:MAG: pantetheine-phosphate adenylyltransferase [Propionibacteriaceae bacterium]|nr:pantetheine-phosphate adenylyltransferase [Micropruina sp.]HBX82829.1 pantetheine-phosphate adenylyltransferase [Propionibacteriaceae bacterium]HBY23423.1 pantetheine-phosphate adenylyltransferase [Propionibacteriaceae bacterium]
MRAVLPGSFDPVHLGHLNVIARAAVLFDEVIVAVGQNVAKSYLFTGPERVELLRAAVVDLPSVHVEPLEGLVVDFCRARRVNVVVKGVRSGADFDYELQMAQLNHAMTNLETVFVPTAPDHSYLSSSRIREIATLGGDVSRFVTPAVAHAIDGLLP